MKSLILLVIILVIPVVSLAQVLGGDVCANKPGVGVEIRPTGFRNNVEAERFVAAVLNLDFLDPSANFCLVPAAGISERKLVVRTTMRVLGTERGQDELKPQLIRSGIQIAVGEVARRVPSGVRSTIRRTSKPYTQEPRIRVTQVEVTTEAWMYAGREVVWKGLGSRVFVVQESNFYGYRPKKIEIMSGGNFGELIPYGNAVVLPSESNVQNRAEQLMKLLVTMDALQKKNILTGGQQLLAQRTP